MVNDLEMPMGGDALVSWLLAGMLSGASLILGWEVDISWSKGLVRCPLSSTAFAGSWGRSR